MTLRGFFLRHASGLRSGPGPYLPGLQEQVFNRSRNHLGKVTEKQGLRAESRSFSEFSFFPLSLMADFVRKWSSVALSSPDTLLTQMLLVSRMGRER